MKANIFGFSLEVSRGCLKSNFGLNNLANNTLEIIRKDKKIIISKAHEVYLNDILNSFDYYFGSVDSVLMDGYLTVDFSKPAYHDVVGFDLMPIHFQSFSEPIASTQQYMEFAGLKKGDIVLDLGAYSGLTSILFAQCIGSEGHVVGVEADSKNLLSARRNINLFEKIANRHISLFEGAVWNHSSGIYFSEESNMGSSAEKFLNGRGVSNFVPSITLSQLVELYSLPRVDFIKCDIEGGETVVFDDSLFFVKHKPRILMETHMVNGNDTRQQCIDKLSTYGYRCQVIKQNGVELNLLGCVPMD